jgi:hypothetical protein
MQYLKPRWRKSPPAYSSAFSVGHNSRNHPSSVFATMAETMRAGKYADLNQLDLLQVRQGESQRQ